MNSSHTPGPWDARPDGTNAFGVDMWSIDQSPDAEHSEYGVPVTTIAQVYDSSGDAALIAAAPDLLAACHGLLDLIDKISLNAPHDERYKAAGAAIAKARG